MEGFQLQMIPRVKKSSAAGQTAVQAAWPLELCNLAGSLLLEVSVVGKDGMYVYGKSQWENPNVW